jgi:hypothetical protein
MLYTLRLRFIYLPAAANNKKNTTSGNDTLQIISIVPMEDIIMGIK